MKQPPKLFLVITDAQGSGNPGQLREKSLDQDLNLNFSSQPAGEPNSAIYLWN
jgi:hypothetical protein